jgi:hypothetical protein
VKNRSSIEFMEWEKAKMTSSSSMRSERMSKLRIRGKCLKEAKTQTNTLTSQTMRKVRMMRPKIKLNRRKSVKRERRISRASNPPKTVENNQRKMLPVLLE